MALYEAIVSIDIVSATLARATVKLPIVPGDTTDPTTVLISKRLGSDDVTDISVATKPGGSGSIDVDFDVLEILNYDPKGAFVVNVTVDGTAKPPVRTEY